MLHRDVQKLSPTLPVVFKSVSCKRHSHLAESLAQCLLCMKMPRRLFDREP